MWSVIDGNRWCAYGSIKWHSACVWFYVRSPGSAAHDVELQTHGVIIQ